MTMTMTAKEIKIETSKTDPDGYGSGPRVSKVTADDPWDKLSKIFKRYTHTIQYTGDASLYNSSEYTITVVGPSGSSEGVSSNKFTYNTPIAKVTEVEVYFSANSIPSSSNPFVVGFVYESTGNSISVSISKQRGSGRSSGKCYYTWSQLTTGSSSSGTSEANYYIAGGFGEKDLINGLLEELGRTSVGVRQNKLVINLNQKPNETEFKYPESAYFTQGDGKGDSSSSKQVKVTKEAVYVNDKDGDLEQKVLYGYVKYVHTVPGCDVDAPVIEFEDSDAEVYTGCGVEDLYVSYGNNSRFFQAVSGSGSSKIDTVTAYFDTGTNKLVLFTFSLALGTEYEYKYYDFVNDFESLTGRSTVAKVITTLTPLGGGGTALKTRLEQESERLRPLIAFKNEDICKNNENISKGQEEDVGPGGGEEKFKKVTMRPDTKNKGSGFAVGPWYVCNNHLFTGFEPGKKIEPEDVLNDISTGNTSSSDSSCKKYNSISVYYSLKGISEYKALLVEFEKAADSSIGGGTKTYIKRLNKGGTEWAKETGISSSGVVVTADKLAKIAKGASRDESERSNPLIEFRNGDTGNGKNENVTTSQPSNIGHEGGYKFMKVTMEPDTSDLGDGSSSGPWTVYNDYLIGYESGAKFDESVLRRIVTTDASDSSSKKYGTITVYYAVTGKIRREHRALLVKFDPDSTGSCGRRKYIKRVNQDGTKWESTYIIGIGTGSDSELLRVLKQESKRLKPMIEFVKGDSSSKNENIKTKQENFGQDNKFIKVTMTPNTDDKPDVLGEVRGSPFGPWVVYSNYLFTYEQDATIDDRVLTSFFTTGDASGTSSSSKKYSSITVYYFLKGRSHYGALLVEFVPGSGSRKYIKRVNQDGTKWAKADSDVGTGGGKVTAEVLAQIAKDAKIIGSNVSIKAMMSQQKEIQINTKATTGSHPHSGYGIEVDKDEPWDPLSKIFKKYTHTIEYPGDEGGYLPSNYNITVYSKGSGGSVGSGFTLSTPNPKVDKVEVYFRYTADVNRENPLIVGFVYATSSKSCTSGFSTSGSDSNICYYTWANLANRQYDFTITADSISDKDLVTRLLEELGTRIPHRQNKPVIRLDEKPGDGVTRYEYPDSGHFKNKQVTVKKLEVRDVPGFDKYEHTFSSINTGIGAGAASHREGVGSLDVNGKRGDSSPGVVSSGSDTTTATQQKEIRINTKATTGSHPHSGYGIEVDKDIPWDPLSKIFKKYTYTIKYLTEGADSQYNINVVAKSRSSSSGSDTFQYNNPNLKVRKVEVFFKADDIRNNTPLIVHFVYDEHVDCGISSGDSNKYYRWSELKGQTENGDIGAESFSKNDLVTVLLEELGKSSTTGGGVSDRKDKLVIRLDERPPNAGGGRSDHRYPATGFYSSKDKQVTVKKVTATGIDGYEKYEHTVGTGEKIEEFYVTYRNDSRYFKIVSGSRSRSEYLKKVTAYYDTATGGEGGCFGKLVLFVMSIPGKGSYVYSYFDFVNDLKKVTAEKATAEETFKPITSGTGLTSIGDGSVFQDSELKSRLEGESKRLKPMIEFVKGDSSSKNENIKTKQENFGQDNKFIKVTMTPNTDDKPDVLGEVRGSPFGPWKVYNYYLIDYEDVTIDESVLRYITTGDVTSSSSKKYSSISVYYAFTGYDNSKFSALLVEFVKDNSTGGSIGIGGGDKIYFKRVKQGSKGTQWERPLGFGICTSDTKQLVQKLTKIGTDAGIIVVSSSVTAKVIQLETKQKGGTYTSGGATVIVTKDEPWDKLSKLFKKYTHTIHYPGGTNYDESNYILKVHTQHSRDHTFTLKNPDPQVQKVKVYFWVTHDPSDVSITGRHNPLVVGFVYATSNESGTSGRSKSIGGGTKCYYTWGHLKNNNNKTGDTGAAGAFSEKDLVTRLLEEAGAGPAATRMNKLVIRLGEQSNNGQYPDSGHYSVNRKITVKKVEPRDGVPGYDKYDRYVHTVPSDTGRIDADGFYVSYENNSRYFNSQNLLQYNRLKTVTAYFDKSTNRLVLIVFTFKEAGGSGTNNKLYAYRYSQFVSDLRRVKANRSAAGTAKEMGPKDAIGDSGDVLALQTRLQEECNKLEQIEFVTGDSRYGPSPGGGENQNIKTELLEVKGPDTVSQGAYKFMKVVMTANTSDGPVGPWIVYNDYLISGYESGVKIQPDVLTSITSSTSSKYSSITVYYAMTNETGSGDNWALLVKFDQAGSRTDGSFSTVGDTKYYKRENQKGNKWVDDSSRIGTGGGDSDVLRLLQDQWKKLRPLIAFVKGGDGRENQNITTESEQVCGPVGQGNNTFMKVTFKPDTSEAKGGPWEVYSSKLIDRGSVKKIEPEDVLGGIYTIGDSNKYQSISLYYYVIGGKNKALLVEFVPGITCVRKTYIKRTATGGTQWAKADLGDSIGTRRVTAQELTEISKSVGISVEGAPIASSKQGCGSNSVISSVSVDPTVGSDGSPRGESGGGGNSNGSDAKGAGGIKELYVTYQNNSRYFKTDESGKASLEKVTAYFESTGDKKLVLITFTLSLGTEYEYKYFDFINELKSLRGVKDWSTDVKIIVTELTRIATVGGHSDSELKSRLPEESERLRPLIEFVTGDGTSRDGRSSNQHISTEQKDISDGIGGENFKKVTMTPNTNDLKGGGSSVGPWEVHSSKLIDEEPSTKIKPGVLDGTTSNQKYGSISVYYSTKTGGGNDKALLVEFDPGGNGNKTYYRRDNDVRNTWAIAPEISSTSDTALIPTLNHEIGRLNPLIEFVKGDGQDSSSNKHIATTPASDLDGGHGIVGPDYKFKKVTMTPNTGVDGPGVQGGASPLGPWRVYNNSQLIGLEDGVKIPDSVLSDFFTTDVTRSDSNSKKYKKITVYYIVTVSDRSGTHSSSDKYKALLIEFYAGDGRKIYIKRTGTGGDTWESVPGIGISIGIGSGGEVTADDLAEIAKDANILVASSSVISRGLGGGKRAIKAGLESWFRVGSRVVSWLGRGPRLGLWPRLGSRVVSRVGRGLVSRVGKGLKGAHSPDSNTTSSNGSSDNPREAGTAGPIVEGHSNRSQGDSVEGPEVLRVEASGPDSESQASTITISNSGPRGIEGLRGHSSVGGNGQVGVEPDVSGSSGQGDRDDNIGSPDAIGDHGSPQPASPSSPREEPGEARAASSLGEGVEGAGAGSSVGITSTTAESQVNRNPGNTSTTSDTISSGSSSRPGETSSNLPGGPGGGSSSEGSDATIGGAVGGGVSLIVASGGTGFGIYRYRHVFLSLIGK